MAGEYRISRIMEPWPLKEDEKSCENCFNAWLIEQVQKKLWSPPRDARAAIQCCSRCSRFPLPLEDCWTAIPEVEKP